MPHKLTDSSVIFPNLLDCRGISVGNWPDTNRKAAMLPSPEAPQPSIPMSQLSNCIPHRGPMVWLDEVISFGPKSGECSVRLKEDALYYSEGHLRASSLLEFIAQAQGLTGVCRERANAGPGSTGLAEAFLVSITQTEFLNPQALKAAKAGDVLSVRLGAFRKMGPLTLFSGSVWTSDQLCLVNTQMKAFTNFKS